MSLLRPVSIFLRNFLIQQHPYFSCCASCGEIKTPLQHRLCTSLSPAFDVDAVFPSWTGTGQQMRDTAGELAARLPWLRQVVFITDAPCPEPGLPEKTRCLTAETLFSAWQARNPGAEPFLLEALLHQIPGLSEQYLVFSGNEAPAAEKLILDFYTPNGIPLLPSSVLSTHMDRVMAAADPPQALLESAITGPGGVGDARTVAQPRTRESSAAFLPFWAAVLDGVKARGGREPGYAPLLEQWLCVTGQGVPVPCSCKI